MSDTLLPCPFCGGEARIEQHEKSKWLAFCDDVYGCGTEGWYEDTPEEAIAAWNRRSPTIPPDVRETMREALSKQRSVIERRADTVERYGIDPGMFGLELAAIDAALAWIDVQGGGRNG